MTIPPLLTSQTEPLPSNVVPFSRTKRDGKRVPDPVATELARLSEGGADLRFIGERLKAEAEYLGPLVRAAAKTADPIDANLLLSRLGSVRMEALYLSLCPDQLPDGYDSWDGYLKAVAEHLVGIRESIGIEPSPLLMNPVPTDADPAECCASALNLLAKARALYEARIERVCEIEAEIRENGASAEALAELVALANADIYRGDPDEPETAPRTLLDAHEALRRRADRAQAG